LRLINFITLSMSQFFKSLMKISKRDLVIVVTTPPSLPFVIFVACKLVGARSILRIEDIYPETLIATGIVRKESMLARVMSSFNRWLYRGVDHITVLGRDMKELVKGRIGGNERGDKISIIPNWTDLDLVAPEPKSKNALLRELNLTDKFVVQCAGNMGRAQGIENMFMAAEILREKENIHFLFIGEGVKKPWMQKTIEDKGLRILRFSGKGRVPISLIT